MRAARRAPSRGAVIALGGGSVLSERVRAALARHVTCCSTSTPRRRGSACGAGDGAAARPLARDREAFAALHAERARRSTRSSPTRLCRPLAPRRGGRARCRRPARARRRARRHAPAVGAQRLGRVPGARRAAACCGAARLAARSRGRSTARRSRAVLRDRRERRARCTPRGSASSPALDRDRRRASSTRRSRAPKACGGARRARA